MGETLAEEPGGVLLHQTFTPTKSLYETGGAVLKLTHEYPD